MVRRTLPTFADVRETAGRGMSEDTWDKVCIFLAVAVVIGWFVYVFVAEPFAPILR